MFHGGNVGGQVLNRESRRPPHGGQASAPKTHSPWQTSMKSLHRLGAGLLMLTDEVIAAINDDTSAAPPETRR